MKKTDGFENPSPKIDGVGRTRRTRTRGAPAMFFSWKVDGLEYEIHLFCFTGCPVDFDPLKNGDQIPNFASNGLPLKTIAFLILRKLGILKFLKNLENCKFFYFGEKWWSKFIWIQFGSVNGLPPPEILIFSSIHSTGHFTIKMAPKTEFFNSFDNFQSIGSQDCGF